MVPVIPLYADLNLWLCLFVGFLQFRLDFKPYFASAEIMWMLNEALLLLRKVVIIFEKKSYFKYYLLIGWGTILIICR